MKVRIIQLLCPERHCVVAVAYDSADGQPIPEMTQELLTQFAASGLDPWCGICRSRTLTPEDMPMRFKTMGEAAPFLEELARRQAWTREYFKTSKG